MAKLAMLLGMTGAGKGHVVKNLPCSPQILVIDLIREDAVDFLHPGEDVPIDRKTSWPIWDELTRRTNITEAIRSGIEKRCRNFDPNRNSIAEGGLLAGNSFRSAFLKTLKTMGMEIESTLIGHLHPSPEVVLQNILNRDRPNQRDVDLAKVKVMRTNYNGWAEKVVSRTFTTTQEAIAALEQFFGQSSESPTIPKQVM